MKKFGYKILWYGLQVLIHIKRLGVWLFQGVVFLGAALGRLYRQTIGFRLYNAKRPRGAGFFRLMTRRAFLQIVLFVAGIFFSLPHSRAVAENTLKIPGRDTLIYKIVGPGDEDFYLEEVKPDTQKNSPAVASRWQEGAIGSADVAPIEAAPTNNLNAISVSQRAGAINKPTIIYGESPSGGQTLAAPSPSVERPVITEYTVKAGDSINAIARRYKISVESILAANHLTPRSYIRQGDKLKILPITGVVHRVRRGDTIGRIARLYGVNEVEIVNFNSLSGKGKNLRVGRELIIPHGVSPAPREIAVREPKTAPEEPARLVEREIAPPPDSAEAVSGGSGYLWPTAARRITQYFSLRHTGVDIAGPIGTPLYAARDGVVTQSQCGWNGGYGCHIIIDHGDGIETLYGHASALFVHVGDSVTRGQAIAAMGSTGHATGPHIHFEVRVNGRRVNPLRFVR